MSQLLLSTSMLTESSMTLVKTTKHQGWKWRPVMGSNVPPPSLFDVIFFSPRSWVNSAAKGIFFFTCDITVPIKEADSESCTHCVAPWTSHREKLWSGEKSWLILIYRKHWKSKFIACFVVDFSFNVLLLYHLLSVSSSLKLIIKKKKRLYLNVGVNKLILFKPMHIYNCQKRLHGVF